MSRSVQLSLADDRVQLGVVVAGLPTICASPGTQILIGVCVLVVVVVANGRHAVWRRARPRAW